jgi:hypothetical protein
MIPLVDTSPFEHREVFERWFPVLSTRRDDDGPCENLRSAVDLEGVPTSGAINSRRRRMKARIKISLLDHRRRVVKLVGQP